MAIAEIDGRSSVPAGTRLGDRVSLPRFIFLASAGPADQRDRGGDDELLWLLVSTNNRPLGRCATGYPTYAECRDAVQRLRAGIETVTTAVSPVERSGQWKWRVGSAGTTVATASRSYLRLRECQYNLACFLAAVPTAAVGEGARRRFDRRAGAPVHESPGSRSGQLAPLSRLLPGSGLGGTLR